MGPAQATALRGAAVLADPWLNKGTAFTRQERQALDLEGLLPWQEESLPTQVERVWRAFADQSDDLQRYDLLVRLRQSNQVLFHRFLADHIEAVLPVVYTPTVGRAIQTFNRRLIGGGRALFLAPPQQERIGELLRQAVAAGPVDLLLVTDSQAILGLGDQGVGGIEICHGKLAVYTLCAGLHPARVLPVVLDVGTDRPELLEDPLYPGWQQPRLRGDDYDGFVDRFVEAVREQLPAAFLHWEDFGSGQAARLLERHRERLPSFNDDIQGTSGVASAAILAACRGQGLALADQRIVVFGAGTAGCGIAGQLLRQLQAEGLTAEQARSRLWAIDRDGLLWSDQSSPAAAALGRPRSEEAQFPRDDQGRIGLQQVVDTVRPTVLIGTSTVAGAFHHGVVTSMLRGLEPGVRPIILPLSNPTALAEATPADLLAWSQCRALVATGSPFEPVAVAGGLRRIGQCNNCFLYPGLGFAAVAVGASRVSDGMIAAATLALAERIPAACDPEAPLMPAIAEVRSVSVAVAEAVARAAVREGLACLASSEQEALERLERARWTADYGPVHAI
ncbi:MAG: NAD-dependent malic enzyme [Prochlorococcaceae cyanobacterium]|jgi:malate dehydrogenase (oxaloacetate-decarboxylating)